ncbi:MAG: glycosyltransferase [Bacteroidia bacterium]
MKALVFPFDLLSHYLRCISFTKKFPERSYFFANSFSYSNYLKESEIETFEVRSFNAFEVMEKSEKFDFSWMNEEDLEKVFLSQVAVIQMQKPDAVIGDMSPTLKMAAEYTNTKYESLLNGYMSPYYAGVRHVSRTHYSYNYVNKLPRKIGERVTKIAEKFAFKEVHKPFRKLRKKYGLTNVYSYLNELEGDITYICDLPELFPQRNLPNNYKFIGPLYNSYSPKIKNSVQLVNNKPNILITMGSSGSWQDLKFLNDTKYNEFQFIVAGDSKGQLNASHFLHYDFLNFDEILPSSDIMICHGGNGTIYEGIRHKKYMLCLTRHFEQEWNAKRIEELGLGLVINDNPKQFIDSYLFDKTPFVNENSISLSF